MKRLPLTSLLAGFAFAASAQSVGVTVQPTVQDDLRSDVGTRDVRDHHCLRETGSLITTSQNQRALRRATDIADYMNWFEATQMKTRSGAFDNYLKTAAEISEQERKQKGLVGRYLDEIEKQLEP